jgi:hypothetical protein
MAEVLDRPATLRLNPSDPVVVAMRDIAAGEMVAQGEGGRADHARP